MALLVLLAFDTAALSAPILMVINIVLRVFNCQPTFVAMLISSFFSSSEIWGTLLLYILHLFRKSPYFKLKLLLMIASVWLLDKRLGWQLIVVQFVHVLVRV